MIAVDGCRLFSAQSIGWQDVLVLLAVEIRSKSGAVGTLNRQHPHHCCLLPHFAYRLGTKWEMSLVFSSQCWHVAAIGP